MRGIGGVWSGRDGSESLVGIKDGLRLEHGVAGWVEACCWFAAEGLV